MKKYTLYFLLVIIFAIWGGGMVAMKYTYSMFSIIQVVFLRVSMAACFYAAIYKRWIHLPYQPGDWKYLCALALFEPCLLFLCETAGMMYTSASQGGIIVACMPICVGIAGWLFLGEALSGRIILGMLLAVSGVAGVSCCVGSTPEASNPLLGNAFMGGAVLASTGYAICARHLTKRYSFIAISAIQAIGGTLFFMPLTLFFTTMPQSMHIDAILSILYLGIMVGICAYMGFNYSLQVLPAWIVALFSNLIPVFTCLFAFLILGEKMSSLQIAFIGIALLGVVIAGIPSKKQEHGNVS